MKTSIAAVAALLLLASSTQAQIIVGPPDNNFGAGSTSNAFSGGIVFDVQNPVILNSVNVYPDGAGQVVVNLRNSAGTLLATASGNSVGQSLVSIPCAFSIGVGVGYTLDAEGTTTSALYRHFTGASYPYVAPGLMSITGSRFGLSPWYYFFYGIDITPGPVPQWESNDAEASFDFDGVTLSDPINGPGAQSTRCATGTTTVNIASTNVGLPWDITINVGERHQPLSTTNILTPHGQIGNAAVFPGVSVWLNDLRFTDPFPGNISAVLPASSFGLVTSAQMFIVSPSHPDNVALSQSCEIETRNIITGPLSQPGPTGDDDNVAVNLCTPFPFYGTSYTTLFVNANGFVSFGSATTGSSTWSATVTNALGNAPFAGVWSDFSPNVSGAISISDSVDSLEISFSGLPYFGEPGTSSSFQITLFLTGFISLWSLNGIDSNPLTNGTPTDSDNFFLGLSMGNAGATDAGPVDFLQPFGSPAVPSDMIYESIANAGGLPPSIMGGRHEIIFSPSGPSYTWIGF